MKKTPAAASTRNCLFVQKLEAHDDHAQHHQHNAGGAVEGLRLRLIGKNGGDTRPDQREDHAQHPCEGLRHTADGEVGHRTRQRREGHDEHAGAYGGLQLIPQHAGQDQQHHHAAAGAHKAADKADHDAADHRLDRPLFGGDLRHGLLGGHDRAHDEFDAQQECHEHGEAAHGRRRQQAGGIAAHHREGQHARHHDKAVLHIQIFVLMIGVGRDGAGQHVGGQGDAHRHIGLDAQKRNQHGADDRGGAHSGKAGAEARAHTREKCYKDRH